MSNNQKIAATAFVGTLVLLALFGIKALLYAPFFLVAGLIMIALQPKDK